MEESGAKVQPCSLVNLSSLILTTLMLQTFKHGKNESKDKNFDRG